MKKKKKNFLKFSSSFKSFKNNKCLMIAKNNSYFGILEAKYIYKVLCRRRQIDQFKIKYKYRKNHLILLSNIFERDIFSFEICNLQTAFLIGKIDFKISTDIFETFNNQQKFAYEIGNSIFSNKKKLSFYLLKNSLKNFVKWLILFLSHLLTLLY